MNIVKKYAIYGNVKTLLSSILSFLFFSMIAYGLYKKIIFVSLIFFLMVLASLYSMLTSVISILNYKISDNVRDLKKYGDIRSIINEIQYEYYNKLHLKHKRWSLTENWFLSSEAFIYLNDIVWVYIKDTEKNIYRDPFMFSGPDYSYDIYEIIIWTKDGTKYAINNSRKLDKVQQIIKAISIRIPYAIYGYSDVLMQLVNNNKSILETIINRNKKDYTNGNEILFNISYFENLKYRISKKNN